LNLGRLGSFLPLFYGGCYHVSPAGSIQGGNIVCLILQHFQAMTGQGNSYQSESMPEQESDRLML